MPAHSSVFASASPIGSFPADPRDIPLHRHIHWRSDVLERARSHAAAHHYGSVTACHFTLFDTRAGRLLALHVRNGSDWLAACYRLHGLPTKHVYMASQQCRAKTPIVTEVRTCTHWTHTHCR